LPGASSNESTAADQIDRHDVLQRGPAPERRPGKSLARNVPDLNCNALTEPALPQYLGLSRAPPPDGRIFIISEFIDNGATCLCSPPSRPSLIPSTARPSTRRKPAKFHLGQALAPDLPLAAAAQLCDRHRPGARLPPRPQGPSTLPSFRCSPATPAADSRERPCVVRLDSASTEISRAKTCSSPPMTASR
jgi:hypothetical protein